MASFVTQADFDRFKDYVNATLPFLGVFLRPAVVGGYDADPNLSADAVVNNAPIGAFYMQLDGTLWQKASPGGPTDWIERFSGLTGGGFGWVRIVDANPTGPGTVTDKMWQDSPNDTVLQQFTVSNLDVTLDIEASFPLVTVNGVPYTLTKTATDIYSGSLAVTLPGGGGDVVVSLLTPDDDAGAVDTSVSVLVAPPTITSALFSGGYPGAQTELKEGDPFQIDIIADKDFDQVVIEDFEACQADTIAVATGTSASVSGTIADRGDSAVLRPARVRVRDAVTGALSDPYDTDTTGSANGVNVVNCNDLRPTVNIGTITYPGGQQALKGSETADVANTLSDFDSVLYESPNGDLSIPSTTTPANPKTVTRISGSFNNSVINFRITATRAANATVTIQSAIVVIANVAPTITVNSPAARLRSGGNNGTSPVDHSIEIASDQPLLNAPSMDADSGGNRGTFQGAFTGAGASWSADLRVDETVPDEKGTFTFENLVATGLAGLVQNTIDSGASYTLGGFVARDLTFAAFATTTSLGTSVEDFSKLTALIFTATNQTALKQSIGTSPPVTDGYTIDATGVNPTSVIWLDTAAAGSNSGGTAQITGVEETV